MIMIINTHVVVVDHVDGPVAAARRLWCHAAQAVALEGREELGKTRRHAAYDLAAVAVLREEESEIERRLLLEPDLTAVRAR